MPGQSAIHAFEAGIRLCKQIFYGVQLPVLLENAYGYVPVYRDLSLLSKIISNG